MMNLKLGTVVFGTQVVDGRDGKVWTIARKDSKAKTLILTDADGKERPFALNTVNRNFDEVLVEEVVAEEPTEAEVAEVEEPKAEKKVRRNCKHTKKTFEELVADIPALGNMQIVRNKKNEAVVKRGKMQIFRYTGPRLVCIRERLVNGLAYTTHSYGHVVAPTRENMLAILKNAG